MLLHAAPLPPHECFFLCLLCLPVFEADRVNVLLSLPCISSPKLLLIWSDESQICPVLYQEGSQRVLLWTANMKSTMLSTWRLSAKKVDLLNIHAVWFITTHCFYGNKTKNSFCMLWNSGCRRCGLGKFYTGSWVKIIGWLLR